MTILAILLSPFAVFWFYALRKSLTDIRAHRDADEVARIEDGFTSWTDPTPPTPLRSLAWPARQTPTELAAAYDTSMWVSECELVRPWTHPDWALNTWRQILAAERQYAELVAV